MRLATPRAAYAFVKSRHRYRRILQVTLLPAVQHMGGAAIGNIALPRGNSDHENLRIDGITDMEHSSIKNRNFGVVIGVFFIILGVRLFMKNNALCYAAFPVAIVFLLISVVTPDWLHPLNRIWTGIGIKMGSVMTPVSMLIIYIITVLPTAFIMQRLGKDPLRLKFDKNTNSYWMSRSDATGPPGTMKNQF